ncbi:MAG: permease-like cell division protein FtsX [Patescibacteria group bacterium]
MSLFINLWRIIVTAWKHFVRNLWLALTTVFVLVLALLSVNVLLGVNALLTGAVRQLEDKIDVSVYFAAATPQAVLEQAKFAMVALPQVKSAELVSAEQALAQFKQANQNDPKVLDALAELEQNPLGGVLILKARKPADYPFLLEALKNPQFDFAIESKNFDDHAFAINRVREIGASVSVFGAGLIGVFALFSILIVFNTVRVAIYTQREEIGIMRLVGASNAFVRLPFVLEGIFLALFALLISAGGVALALAYLEPNLRGLFDGSEPGLIAYFQGNIFGLAVAQGGTLALLVALSSWAAVGKYLKK